MKEYKAAVYQEGWLSSVIFGTAKVNPIAFTEFLNELADDGWQVVTMDKDIRRTFFFWKREAYVVILERQRV